MRDEPGSALIELVATSYEVNQQKGVKSIICSSEFVGMSGEVLFPQRRNAFFPSFQSRNTSMGTPKNELVEVTVKKTLSPPSRLSDKIAPPEIDLAKMLIPKKAPIKKSIKKIQYVPKNARTTK